MPDKSQAANVVGTIGKSKRQPQLFNLFDPRRRIKFRA
jgi:hypothetical protein